MAIELRTPLCRELGIDHPVFSVGFASGARAELAAAVSTAGGFGVLGEAACSRMRSAPRSRERGR